jgi:hypothetical protein
LFTAGTSEIKEKVGGKRGLKPPEFIRMYKVVPIILQA